MGVQECDNVATSGAKHVPHVHPAMLPISCPPIIKT